MYIVLIYLHGIMCLDYGHKQVWYAWLIDFIHIMYPAMLLELLYHTRLGSRIKFNNQYVCEKTRVSFNVIKKSVCLSVCLSCNTLCTCGVACNAVWERVCLCVCVCVEKGVWRMYLTQYKQLKIKINRNDRLDSAAYRYLCIEYKHCRILQQSRLQ